MMRLSRTQVLRKCLAAVMAFAVPIAQALELGALSLATAQTRPMSSVTFSRAPATFSTFARAVGGVAFTETAASSDGSQILKFQYDASAPDGQRLKANVKSLNGTVSTVTVEAYDWTIVPLARLVLTDATGAVTLFGHLEDKELEEKYKEERDAMIANYHPAIENTLLGLRLIQADMMVFEPNATDLFKEAGAYILGAGEKPPTAQDLKANQQRFNFVQNWIEAQPTRHQSYITGDIGSKITYKLSGSKIVVTGEPTWFCWRRDNAGEEKALQKVAYSLSPQAFTLFALSRRPEVNDLEFARLSEVSPAPTSPLELFKRAARNEALYTAVQLVQQATYAGKPNTLVDIKALKDAVSKADYPALDVLLTKTEDKLSSLDEATLQRLSTEIHGQMNSMKHAMHAVPVVQMEKYSQDISKIISSQALVNPTVGAALKISIHLAALFRNAKAQDKHAYEAFVASIGQVKIDPRNPPNFKVVTPAVYPRK